jgi:acetylornithine deacetylase/succinyl-diaminopimelate desuccinylase-like protein
MDPVTQYLERHQDRFVQDLSEALRIPSVSTEPARKGDCRRCAEHLGKRLEALGMSKVEIVSTDMHPIVYAEWLGASDKPTVLLYGHYDVQPPDPLDLWHSPPFEPVLKDGKLFARGAVDDKGQVYMHLNAIEAHMQTSGKLPLNLKVVIEGEEEVGSESLEPFLHERKRALDADVIVVSDTAMLSPDQPALTYGLRGIVYAQIEVTGPTHDLHSGHFGGAVANPANVLSAIIAALKDGDGRITVPGFYDNVRPLSAADREAMRKLPFDEQAFLAESGAPQPSGEKGYSTHERATVRPTLDVNGIWGGYTNPEGAKTVLPSRACAKVSMRIVPDQDPAELFQRFESYVRRLAPPTVSIVVRDLHGCLPFLTDPAHPMLERARRALARAWTKPAAMIREGGSIPVMATFEKTFGLPSILMGFGLDDDNVHAPNEKISMSSYHGGTRSAAYLYEEIARGA